MAEDSAELVVAGSASVYVAPVGSTAPTDADTPPAAAFKHLGFTTQEGERVTDSRTIADVFAHQSFYALRRIVTARDFRIRFSLMQWNYENVSFAFGGAVVTGTSPDYKVTPPDPAVVDSRALILDADDGGRLYRWYLPKCIVVEDMEAAFTRNEAAVLPVTVSVTPTGTDDPWLLFVADAAFSAT